MAQLSEWEKEKGDAGGRRRWTEAGIAKGSDEARNFCPGANNQKKKKINNILYIMIAFDKFSCLENIV